MADQTNQDTVKLGGVPTRKVKGVVAVKEFFSVPGKEITFDELKALSTEDKRELYPLCAKGIGAELEG